MKKILGMLLACMCLCTNLVMASNEPSQSTNVELDVPTEYTWTAPASLDLIEGTPVSGTVEVSKNVIPEGAKLVISLAAENSFIVTSDEGATRTYSITKGGTAVNAGDTIMEVAAGTNNASQALNFAVESVSGGKKAGTFKGTANFTAKVNIPPKKGDIVTLSQLGLTDVDVNADSTTDTFRVLSADGSNVKLLAMDSYKSAYFGSNNTYSGSTLDDEMTNYYNALPANVQNAIVEQNINQSTYSWASGTSESADFSAWYKNSFTESDSSGTNYYLNRTTEANVGNRKVYALDVDDVISYLGSTSTPQDLNELFFNQRSSVSRDVWLRSASAGNTYDAFYVFGDFGDVIGDRANGYEYEVRPAFVINLG